MHRPRLGPDDPLNQHVRYPVARAFVRAIDKTPIHPNHVTLAALLVGLTGSYLVTRGLWIPAFLLLELRMTLDCVDGELARTKKLSSARGRMFDELGDAVAYVAFVVAIGIRLHDWRLPLGLLVVGTLCALAHDFYKNLPAEQEHKGFGKFFQRVQRLLFPRHPISPLRTALLSWDLGLTILHVGVLTGRLYEASIAAILYGVPTLFIARSQK